MAIFHMAVKTGSRAGGKSARAKDEYIERRGVYARKRKDVLISESGNMPEWARKEPLGYWKAADEYERVNGRLYKEIEFALPMELSRDECINLVREYATHITEKEHLPYSWAIHVNDPKNPHCHLIVSERVNDNIERTAETWFRRYNAKNLEAGGARKTEALKPVEWLEGIREDWSAICNRALERAGVSVRIDHRSLEAQGSDLEPTRHVGVGASALERKGIETERGNINRAAQSRNAIKLEITRLSELVAVVSTHAPQERDIKVIIPDKADESRKQPEEEEETRKTDEARRQAEAAKAEEKRRQAEELRRTAEAEKPKTEREKRILALAETIAAEQRALRRKHNVARIVMENHIAVEPKHGFLWESKGHKEWAETAEAMETEVQRLWEACGGDMGAPDGGRGEADRRLTPEYARKQAETLIAREEAEEQARQQAEEARKAEEVRKIAEEAQREAEARRQADESRKRPESPKVARETRQTEARKASAEAETELPRQKEWKWEDTASKQVKAAKAEELRRQNKIAGMKARDTVSLELDKKVVCHVIDEKTGKTTELVGVIVGVEDEKVMLRSGGVPIAIAREKSYFTAPEPERDILDEYEAELASKRSTPGTGGFHLQLKKAYKMLDIARARGMDDDDFVRKYPAAMNIFDRDAEFRERERGRGGRGR